MSSGSATAYLLWAVLACLFLAFLLVHLWGYDRFHCLRWNAGRQPGAFKRVMTYSYVLTVPLFVLYAIGMTVVKFREGWYVTPTGETIAKPVQMWQQSDRRWALALDFVIALIWSLELITHLEELTFWLFLIHQGPFERDWFDSWEFRTWQIGTAIAVLALPTTALIARGQLDTADAWIFLVGTSGALATTLAFLYVLRRFPRFVRHVKAGGADAGVVNRLVNFYRLNLVRVLFRFLFTIPLLVLSIDAVQARDIGLDNYEIFRGAHPVAGNPFWTDLLLMLGAVGCFVSSAITLVIFFPWGDAPTPSARPSTSVNFPSQQPAATEFAGKSPSIEGFPQQNLPQNSYPHHRGLKSADLRIDPHAFTPAYPLDYADSAYGSPPDGQRSFQDFHEDNDPDYDADMSAEGPAAGQATSPITLVGSAGGHATSHEQAHSRDEDPHPFPLLPPAHEPVLSPALPLAPPPAAAPRSTSGTPRGLAFGLPQAQVRRPPFHFHDSDTDAELGFAGRAGVNAFGVNVGTGRGLGLGMGMGIALGSPGAEGGESSDGHERPRHLRRGYGRNSWDGAIHPYVTTFTSPIDLYDPADDMYQSYPRAE